MKKLLPFLILACTAQAQETPEAALRQFIEHVQQGRAQEAAALIHLSPELLRHADKNTVLKGLTQCLRENRPPASLTIQSVREDSNDGQRAVLRMTLAQGGSKHTPPPFAAFKSDNGWRIDTLTQLLQYECRGLDIGSPLPAAQALLDAYTREDAKALADLIYIDPDDIDLPPDDPALDTERLAHAREQIAHAKAAGMQVTLTENPVIEGLQEDQCVDIPVTLRGQDGEEADFLTLCKTGYGWKADYPL